MTSLLIMNWFGFWKSWKCYWVNGLGDLGEVSAWRDSIDSVDDDKMVEQDLVFFGVEVR